MVDQPRYTRIPNAILDGMADLTEPELRVLLIITRKTIGWQKECDLISLTQLEKFTGLSRPAVNKALHTAIARGWVECTGRGKQGTGCYKLTSELVNDVNQLTEITSKQGLPVSVNDVNRSTPELVNDVNTQKKDLKEKKETPSPQIKRNPDRAMVMMLMGKGIESPKVANEIAAMGLDYTTVEQSIDNLLANKTSIPAIVGFLRSTPPEPGRPYPRARAPAGKVAVELPVPPDRPSKPVMSAEARRALLEQHRNGT